MSNQDNVRVWPETKTHVALIRVYHCKEVVGVV